MKIVKSRFLFFTPFLVLFFFLFFLSSSVFAQLEKTACQEILGGLKVKDFNGISIITHVLTTDSLVQKPSIFIASPLLIVFKETYLIIESDTKKNQRNLYLPYNRIKFITTYNWKNFLSSGNSIEIYLMD